MLLSLPAAETQAQHFGETKSHKRMWRKWSKKSDGFNPNIKHGKATHENSRKQKREEAKELKRQKREARRQMRRSKRRVKRNG